MIGVFDKVLHKYKYKIRCNKNTINVGGIYGSLRAVLESLQVSSYGSRCNRVVLELVTRLGHSQYKEINK